MKSTESTTTKTPAACRFVQIARRVSRMSAGMVTSAARPASRCAWVVLALLAVAGCDEFSDPASGRRDTSAGGPPLPPPPPPSGTAYRTPDGSFYNGATGLGMPPPPPGWTIIDVPAYPPPPPAAAG